MRLVPALLGFCAFCALPLPVLAQSTDQNYNQRYMTDQQRAIVNATGRDSGSVPLGASSLDELDEPDSASPSVGSAEEDGATNYGLMPEKPDMGGHAVKTREDPEKKIIQVYKPLPSVTMPRRAIVDDRIDDGYVRSMDIYQQ